ncbi:murein hydrolase activator EnvC family protein [Gynurincola endophyticus]|jgi:murein DD-endopeptidase MepM/ murein hydrolase activator NlpD|uniref:murein hydrolase activator EnvC family protein n=1 Tax=Gynurincola endophyticus TaxID=2479004 RepID=UPI000F8E2EDA|nr:peptidoglycan DD-metalloendopeptidase family protein [Gynurincola endophyticus]
MKLKLLSWFVVLLGAVSTASAQKQPTLLSATFHIKKTEHIEKRAFQPEAITASKGVLEAPLTNAVLVSNFGYYDIPGTKLKGNNPGITLAVPVWGEAKSVFDGVVKSVYKMDGNYVVIVKHNDILSVYAHLTKVVVKEGEQVYTGDTIGGIETSLTHNGTMEFMMLENSKNVDPLAWLKTNAVPLQNQ